jgi:hypothetical protein
MNGNLTSVWFSGLNSAFITAETGLLHMTAAGVAHVTGFPALPSGAKLVDVHGVVETNMAAVDNLGNIYRLGPSSAAWAVSSGGTSGNRSGAPYTLEGVYMELAVGTNGARLHAYGTCGTPKGGCVVYQDTDGQYYDDVDSATAALRSGGPSLVATGETWFGADGAAVRRHDPNGNFDSMGTPSGLDGGAVVAIRPSLGGVTRASFVLTGPTQQIGHMYRVSATGVSTAPQVDHLMGLFYGYQAASKNDSNGVIVVDMNTTSKTSTITHRGILSNEALDLGAEDWVSGSAFSNGSVLMNGYGDVAIRANGQATFQLRRFPLDLQGVEISAGSTFAVLAAADGTAWRLPYISTSYSEVTFTPKPTGWTALCRASDTEWYFAGKGGAIHSYDGTTTHPMTSGTPTTLSDIDCPQAGTAVACGTGVVLRLSGTAWTTVAGAPAGSITSCRLVGGEIFVSGPNLFARYSNGAWQTLPSKPMLDALQVRSVNDAYAAAGTALVRFDGTAWQVLATSPQPLTTSFVMGSRLVYAGAGGAVWEGQ